MRLWGKKSEPVASSPPDPAEIRARSKAELARLGGRVTDGLPALDPTTPRSGEALADRALVLNAMIGLAYEAPSSLLREWIVANGLTAALSPDETALLARETESLDEQERVNLSWSTEALFALLWAGGIVRDLPIAANLDDEAVVNEALGTLPRVGAHETAREFRRRVRIRPAAELVAMLDLYYCAHWFARDGAINGYDTGVFEQSPILERRKALEWLLNETVDWDDVELGT